MADRYRMELAVEEDGDAVALSVIGADGPVFEARLEGPELDELIRALADGRARLADPVSPELDEGARITNTVVDPTYLVGRNADRDRALLAFRHPGLGWLGFQLRRDVVRSVAEALREWSGE